MSKERYIIQMAGGLEPVVHGPYKNEGSRTRAVRKLHREMDYVEVRVDPTGEDVLRVYITGGSRDASAKKYIGQFKIRDGEVEMMRTTCSRWICSRSKCGHGRQDFSRIATIRVPQEIPVAALVVL